MNENTFRAAVLRESNQDLSIERLNIPSLKRGQVLVKMHLAGLCRSQLMEARGNRGKDNYLPHLLGHEGVGQVVSVGDEVSKVKPGDRVILGWLKGTGIDSGGTTFTDKDGHVINAGPVTTFSEYTVVSENRVVPCESNISDTLAVMLGCALPTGAGMVLNQIKPSPEDSVLVVGLGGIGISALLTLIALKVKSIVVIDAVTSKVELALKLGAHNAYLADDESVSALKNDYPLGFDYAVESGGTTASIELAFSHLSSNGKCVFASHPPEGDKISLSPHELISGRKLEGSWGGGCCPDHDYAIIAKHMMSLDIKLESLISDYFELSQINEALHVLEQNQTTRAFITFDGKLNKYGRYL